MYLLVPLLMTNIISSEKMSMLLYTEYMQQPLDIVNNEIEIEQQRVRQTAAPAASFIGGDLRIYPLMQLLMNNIIFSMMVYMLLGIEPTRQPRGDEPGESTSSAGRSGGRARLI